MSHECVIKIYLPKEGNEKFLYGYKRKEVELKYENQYCKTSLSYFVISSSVSRYEHSRLKFLGSFGESYQEDDEIRITTNERNEIVDILVNDVDKKCRLEILIIHYDKERFLKCYDELYNPVASEENFAIFIAKALKTEQEKTNEGNFFDYLSEQTHNFLIAFSSLSAKVLNPIFQVFNRTVTYQHCSNWRSCLNDGQSRNGFIVLDVLLGILVFLLMNHIQHTGKYFMDLTELIVNRLRILLEMLDGSPAGLKLNVQLNNFLLSCFMYHVELWWNFIVIVEPAVHYLFLPITIFGLMGFSFQCAMLCDVITLITLHAHCFYIYAAMLFKLELYSIRSLLRIVLGRRLNVLKNRVESQTYTNRQLFLATLFFTTLLFLLPTIIIYYLVFASLRLIIYCVSYILMSIQYNILNFPFYKYLRWMTGCYIEATNISMTLISSRKINNINVCQISITVNSSVPWKTSPFALKPQKKLSRPLSIATFAKFLIKGEMMAFLSHVED